MEIIEAETQQALLTGSVTFDVSDDPIPAEDVDAPIFQDAILGTDIFAD